MTKLNGDFSNALIKGACRESALFIFDSVLAQYIRHASFHSTGPSIRSNLIDEDAHDVVHAAMGPAAVFEHRRQTCLEIGLLEFISLLRKLRNKTHENKGT